MSSSLRTKRSADIEEESVNRETGSSPLTRQLADAIADYCGIHGVAPSDALFGSFIKWLRTDKELSPNELKRVREHLQRLGGFSQLRNAFFAGTPTPALIEREGLKGIAKLNKTNVIELAQLRLFENRLESILPVAMKSLGRMAPIGYATKPARGATGRTVTLFLSDLHFGSKLDPRELPVKYDFQEEARALASIIVRVCEFKRDHRKETNLVVFLGGDLIRGKIHDKQAGATAAEQSTDAMYLLTQAIRILASEFKHVDVCCSTGNHDRDDSRHVDRAFENKWDSRATVIYYGIKNHFAFDYKNVSVHIPRTPHCEWQTFGHRIYATHGDTNLNSGNPSKIIDVRNIHRQMADINLAEFRAHRRPYDAFLVGHMHQGLHMKLPAGWLIANPALIPVDGYARGVGFNSSDCGQILFESTPDHVVGDLRFMFVEPEVLKDKSLDKVIIPFKDF